MSTIGLNLANAAATLQNRNQLSSTNSMASTMATSSSSASSSTSTSDITGADFLSLLVSELKNQDPTQPTDPQAYVQQLVGVNSLQQLISINKDLGGTT